MPMAKAVLPALNLSKVKAGALQHDDTLAHDVAARAHRKLTHRDQTGAITGPKANPYSSAQRLVKAVAPGSLSHREHYGAHQQTSGAGHAMIQSAGTFASVYSKPIVVPALLLPSTLENPSLDGPVSARGGPASTSASAAAQFTQMRGALTARGAPPHNLYSASNNALQQQHAHSHAQGLHQQSSVSQHQQQAHQHHAQQQHPSQALQTAQVGSQQSSSRSKATASSQQAASAAAAAAMRSASRASSSTESADAGGAWESGSITPAQALRRYSEYLTSFEQSEILDYPQVYFVGRSGAPKIKGNPHSSKANCGYDDDRGDYVITPHDHLAYRYEILGVLGKGSFGQVVKVHDFKTNTLKAVKVIRNKKRFHHQALVELKVLQHLKQCDPNDEHHVIHMQEHFVFRNHLCITFEMLSVNLYEFVKQNNFAGLSMGLIRRFAQQILVTLKYLKQHKIIHCDLKPENILLRQPNRSIIKVIDFGSSCFVDERVYTYIQSRFYRSPEVILGLTYGCEIDMWSFGAILAELYTGYPLFPGEDEQEQLACIMEVIGLPPSDLVNTASRKKVFFDSAGAPRIAPNSHGKVHQPATKSLSGVLRGADSGFLDLLQACLQWDPAQRITPEQALAHRWIAGDAPAAQPAPSPRMPAPSPRAAPLPPTQQVPATQPSQQSGAVPQTPRGSVGAVALQPAAATAAAAAAAGAALSGWTGTTANTNTSNAAGTGLQANKSVFGGQVGTQVKPLNLTGLQGFASTSASKPPATPRGRFESLMAQQGQQGPGAAAATAAVMTPRGAAAPAGLSDVAGGSSDVAMQPVLSPPGAPVTPGRSSRNRVLAMSLGSPPPPLQQPGHTGVSLPPLLGGTRK